MRSRVRSDATIRLKMGDLLTLLDMRGTRRLKGPGIFRLNRLSEPAGGNGDRIVEVLRTLLEPPEMKRTVAGLRGFKIARTKKGAGTSSPPASESTSDETLWFVDRESGGRYCVPERNSITTPVLRNGSGSQPPPASSADSLVAALTGEGTGSDAFSNSAHALLPPGVHAVTGADGTERMVEVIPVAIPDPDPQAVATVLLQRGCERQLAFLLDRLDGTRPAAPR